MSIWGITKTLIRGAISHHLGNAQGIGGSPPLIRRQFCYLERVTRSRILCFRVK